MSGNRHRAADARPSHMVRAQVPFFPGHATIYDLPREHTTVLALPNPAGGGVHVAAIASSGSRESILGRA